MFFSERLKILFKEDLQKIDNELLKSIAPERGNMLKEVAEHITRSGGKKIRPIMVLMVAKIFSIEKKKVIQLATSIEFIHIATLIHDDVIDNSSLRRKKKTANFIWNNKVSILMGDFLFSQAFKLLVKIGDLNILHILSDVSADMAKAEIWQLDLIANFEMNKATYLELIKKKTANLFAAACEASAIIANATDKEIELIKEFAINFGMAFQIHDDIKDYFGGFEDLGKNPMNDLREKKVTLPLILLFQMLSKKEALTLKEKISQGDAEIFNEITKMLMFYDIKKQAELIKEEFIQKAMNSANKLEIESVVKKDLESFLKFKFF